MRELRIVLLNERSRQNNSFHSAYSQSYIIVKNLGRGCIRKENYVKKKMLILLMVIAILFLSVTMTFASGDKVRGEKAKGPAYQYQVMDPPPFQP